MAETRQFCSFFVGRLCVGIEVERVQEIRSVTAMTRVPLAARAIGGLLNLRGQIVTAIDLRRCLDLSDRPAAERPVNVVLRTADGALGLLVDRMGDVLDVGEDEFELPPSTLDARSREVVRGAYRLVGGLLLVLDIDAIVNGIADDLSAEHGGVRPGGEGHRSVVGIGGV
jgi:purine-binding chemotaxis protein CheW